jgi:hypothetical protein
MIQSKVSYIRQRAEGAFLCTILQMRLLGILNEVGVGRKQSVRSIESRCLQPFFVGRGCFVCTADATSHDFLGHNK